MTRLLRRACAVATLVLLPAAGAQAITVTVSTPCIGPEDPVKFALSGAQPTGMVDLVLDREYLDTVDTGDSGSFTGTFGAPSLGAMARTGHVLSTRQGGSAPFYVTATGAVQKPEAPKPGGRVTLSAYGFIGAKTLYAHYVYRPTDTKRIVRRTIKLGTAQGACGDLTKKRLAALPIKHPTKGVWLVQVDPRATYTHQKQPFGELSVFVG